jgi:hypothetical protein
VINYLVEEVTSLVRHGVSVWNNISDSGSGRTEGTDNDDITSCHLSWDLCGQLWALNWMLWETFIEIRVNRLSTVLMKRWPALFCVRHAAPLIYLQQAQQALQFLPPPFLMKLAQAALLSGTQSWRGRGLTT